MKVLAKLSRKVKIQLRLKNIFSINPNQQSLRIFYYKVLSFSEQTQWPKVIPTFRNSEIE